jgi:hypothetical protein
MADDQNRKKASSDEIVRILMDAWDGTNKFISNAPEFDNLK